MQNTAKLLEAFLLTLQSAPSGKQVQFSVDYMKDQIIITTAPSGFLRFLYQNDRYCAHLKSDGVHLQMFK